MMHWSEKYLAIPYKLHAHTLEGCDCYGLVYLVCKNEFNIELPLFDEEYNEQSDSAHILKLFDEHRDKWRKVDDVRTGDLVEFIGNGTKTHIGIMINDNEFLHNMMQGRASAIGDITCNRWNRKVSGIYRYE